MKNKACCWILIILCAGFVLTSILFVVAVSTLSGLGGKTYTVADNSYLFIRTSGLLTQNEKLPDPFTFMRGDSRASLTTIVQALDHAADDPRIKGVILRPLDMHGFADLRELRQAVERFKDSGKPVYAYLEIGTDRDYYLASTADTIVMIPARSGGLIMLGLEFSSTYLARTLDKVGLKFQVLHIGDYKGAFENFGRDSMSDELRESIEYLYDGVFETYLKETAESRDGLTYEALRGEVMEGAKLLISGDRAKELGLIDLVMDWVDFKKWLSPDDDPEAVTPSRYLKACRRMGDSGNEIAVLAAEGEIRYGVDSDGFFGMDEGIESHRIIGQLKKLREDEDVKAVVLRVNSPGGSALASDLILAEVKRTTEVKPVVVSMSNVAASGGYYISCGASKIIAEPTTITGSIGVVGMVPSAEKMYDKIEARVETISRGRWANFFRIDKDLTEEKRAIYLDFMTDTYNEFVGHVAEHRGMSVEEVQEVAQGRIWTGAQALDRKLVDQLGGFHDAIAAARELAGLEESEAAVKYYPPRRSIIEYVMERLDMKLESFTLIWLSPEEREVREAVEYLKKFIRDRQFVQAIMPMDLNL